MTQSPPAFELRPFQRRVFDAVMNGQRVILQAPTGAGKTRAALAPFLQNFARSLSDPTYESKLPLTCRYAVPLRVLATQFFKEYELSGKKIEQRVNAHLTQTYKKFDQKPVQIQTGEQPDDPQFESALTFCTIDQLLASFLGIPYGIGQRKANINVGAIIGSFLVFDEFHLYPLARNKCAWGARTTTLQMLQMLRVKERCLAPFVLMTATFSSQLISELATMLDATMINVCPRHELTELNAERERHVIVHDSPMDTRTILEQHADCSLVVCNTVLRAQQTFQALSRLVAAERPDVKLVLLHSRFTDDHRKQKQEQLEEALGEAKWNNGVYRGPNIIVIATQVVEVGLNISARVLHTEAAPASSIIQRAGRCGRFARQHGYVHLYPLPPDASPLPYDQQQMQSTLEAFARFNGQHVGFLQEQIVIDEVHSDEDEVLLQAFKRDQSLIHDKMYIGLGAHRESRSITTSLIREVQQTALLIHDNPKTTITERPWEWQTFSLHPSTLESRWDVLHEIAASAQQLGDDVHPMWRAAVDPTVKQEENERRPTPYTWEPISVQHNIRTALIVALSPDVATYTEQLGLVLRDGRLDVDWPQTPFRSERVVTRKCQHDQYRYTQESYAEHISGLFNAYRDSRLQADLMYIAQQLEMALGLRAGAIDHAIRLAIACHDIGKLGRGWQHWAEEWQALLVQTYPSETERYQPRKYPFAHTDHEGYIHRELEGTLKAPRPRHACESAYLASELIEDSIGDEQLARATIAAMARHHAPTSHTYERIKLVPNARIFVQELLDRVAYGQDWSYDISLLNEVINHGGELTQDEMTLPRRTAELETWLYFVIVRALRLADNRSFAYKPR